MLNSSYWMHLFWASQYRETEMLEELHLAIADAKYGNHRFLGSLKDEPCGALVRLRRNRVLYGAPPSYSGKGRPHVHGDKFAFKESDTWGEPDATVELVSVSMAHGAQHSLPQAIPPLDTASLSETGVLRSLGYVGQLGAVATLPGPKPGAGQPFALATCSGETDTRACPAGVWQAYSTDYDASSVEQLEPRWRRPRLAESLRLVSKGRPQTRPERHRVVKKGKKKPKYRPEIGAKLDC